MDLTKLNRVLIAPVTHGKTKKLQVPDQYKKPGIKGESFELIMEEKWHKQLEGQSSMMLTIEEYLTLQGKAKKFDLMMTAARIKQ